MFWDTKILKFTFSKNLFSHKRFQSPTAGQWIWQRKGAPGSSQGTCAVRRATGSVLWANTGSGRSQHTRAHPVRPVPGPPPGGQCSQRHRRPQSLAQDHRSLPAALRPFLLGLWFSLRRTSKTSPCKGLLTQLLSPIPRVSDSTWAWELHSEQAPEWYWCHWSKDHTLRTTLLG